MHYVKDVLRHLTLATEKSLFGMFKGFMDESGITPADPVCVVAGFIGSGQECDRVAEKWSEIVKPLGEFHALEFFRRNPNGGMTGRYKHLEVSDAESCVEKLIDILRDSKLEPIGMALDAKAFLSLSEDERRWMTSAAVHDKTWPMQGAPNQPWFAVFHYCVTQANEYTPDGEHVYLTFDRQQAYEGNAIKIYNELKQIGGKWGGKLAETIVFSSKSEAVLLQSADLLAYVISWLAKEGDVKNVANRVAFRALEQLAINKEYVRAMDIRSLDEHLRSCPFRKTFWVDLSDPDLLEQIRAQSLNVLAVKNKDGLYLTHHIRRSRVKVVQELDAVPLSGLGARNLTVRQDDSTINTRASAENSVNSLQPSQKTSYRQDPEDKPKRI